jgi:hypothetical protein
LIEFSDKRGVLPPAVSHPALCPHKELKVFLRLHLGYFMMHLQVFLKLSIFDIVRTRINELNILHNLAYCQKIGRQQQICPSMRGAAYSAHDNFILPDTT